MTTRKKFAWFVLGCLAVGLVVAVLYIVLAATTTIHAIRGTQQTNTSIAKTNAETLRIIRSCTETAGECSKRNAERLASTVVGLTQGNQRAAAAAASCAANRRHPDFVTVYRCVVRTLAAGDHHKR